MDTGTQPTLTDLVPTDNGVPGQSDSAGWGPGNQYLITTSFAYPPTTPIRLIYNGNSNFDFRTAAGIPVAAFDLPVPPP